MSCISSGSGPRRTSTITTTARRPGRPERKLSISGPQLFRSDFERLANPYPGRSTRSSSAGLLFSWSRRIRSLIRKTLMPRVQPGVDEVRTSFFRATSVLIRLDFPTFDRPANATSAMMGGGSCSSALAEARKSASRISVASFATALSMPRRIFGATHARISPNPGACGGVSWERNPKRKKDAFSRLTDPQSGVSYGWVDHRGR